MPIPCYICEADKDSKLFNCRVNGVQLQKMPGWLRTALTYK